MAFPQIPDDAPLLPRLVGGVVLVVIQLAGLLGIAALFLWALYLPLFAILDLANIGEGNPRGDIDGFASEHWIHIALVVPAASFLLWALTELEWFDPDGSRTRRRSSRAAREEQEAFEKGNLAREQWFVALSDEELYSRLASRLEIRRERERRVDESKRSFEAEAMAKAEAKAEAELRAAQEEARRVESAAAETAEAWERLGGLSLRVEASAESLQLARASVAGRLGVPEDQIDFEVIQPPKRRFLIGPRRGARVRGHRRLAPPL